MHLYKDTWISKVILNNEYMYMRKWPLNGSSVPSEY